MDHDAAAIAGLDVTAERRSSAGLDRGHPPGLAGDWPMARPVGPAEASEDLCQLGPPRPLGRAAQGSAAAQSELIQRRGGDHQPALAQVKLAQRCPDAAMAQQPLDRVKVGAGLQKMGGEGIAQAMQAATLGDAKLGLGGLESAPRGSAGNWLSGVGTREELF